VFALVLAGLSVLVSLAILGAAGLVFLLTVFNILAARGALPEWLVQYENQELPPVDYYDGPRRP